MESMFLWIVLFSGAAVLLLSVFLISSEKELKKRRSEVNDLMARLEAMPAASVATPGQGAEVTGLRAKIQDLQKERAALQDDLDAAHRAIDELRDGKPAANVATLAEVEELRSANTQLDAQVIDLRRQLLNASAPDSNKNERQTQLEHTLIDLKQQLERSQAKIRELESAATPVADVAAFEASQREESQKLHGRIAELEKQLASGTDQARQIESLQHSLRESAKVEQELRDSLRRREEEIPQWQERIAASDEIKKRLLALQPVYDQLIAKQSSLIEHQRAYHGELKSFADFLSASHDGTITPSTHVDLKRDEQTAKPARPVLHLTDSEKVGDNNLSAAAMSAVAAAGNDMAPQAKRGFGVFHALIALVVSGAMAALFWSQSDEQPVTHAAKPLPLAAPGGKAAPMPARPQADPPSETVIPTTPAGKTNELAAPQPAKQTKLPPAPAAAGTYQVTRSTRVFAAPSEQAQQVGEIEPGLKVNVVNARDGWLEVHSKHGRPPGYIRRESAARVGG